MWYMGGMLPSTCTEGGDSENTITDSKLVWGIN